VHYIIAGGTGFIGQALVRFWLQAGHEVTVVSRSLAHIQAVFGRQVQALSWQQIIIQGASLLAGKQAIVNLAGTNIAAGRWTLKRKKELEDSRLIPTSMLANLCAQLGKDSPLLLNASGVGIYGAQAELGTPCTETSKLPAHSASFLAMLAKQWEQATLSATEAGVKVATLRFGVVLAKHGGVLAKLLLAYRLGLGGRLGTGRQPFAWIALSDLCSAIDFICQNPAISGAINLVAPVTPTQAEFAKLLCQAIHRPCLLSYPTWLLKLTLGQMAEELLLSGQHVVPAKLLQADFKFLYPDLLSFMAEPNLL
jgi:uncharacterized protein (TIGR01777 family)